MRQPTSELGLSSFELEHLPSSDLGLTVHSYVGYRVELGVISNFWDGFKSSERDCGTGSGCMGMNQGVVRVWRFL
jgi:hypothetical protein